MSFWSNIRSRFGRSQGSGRVPNHPPTIKEPTRPSNPGLAQMKFLVPEQFRGEDNNIIHQNCPAYRLSVFKMNTLVDYSSGYPHLRMELEFAEKEPIVRHLYLELRFFSRAHASGMDYHTERIVLNPKKWNSRRVILSQIFSGKVQIERFYRLRILATPPGLIPVVIGQLRFALETPRDAFLKILREKQRRFEQGDVESEGIPSESQTDWPDFYSSQSDSSLEDSSLESSGSSSSSRSPSDEVLGSDEISEDNLTYFSAHSTISES